MTSSEHVPNMITKFIRFDSSLVQRLGYLAVFLAAGLFIEYFYLWFKIGRWPQIAPISSALLLTYIGLVAVVVARCLKNIEKQLQIKQIDDQDTNV